MPKSKFFAILDMAVLPMTYDVVGFLSICDVVREINKFEAMDVIVLKGGTNAIGRVATESSEAQKQNNTEKAKRFFNIVIDVPWLFPSVKNVNVIDNRSEVDELTRKEECVFFPNFYKQTFYNTLLYEKLRPLWYKQGRINTLFKEGHNIQRLIAPSYALEDTNAWLKSIRVKKDSPLLVATIREYDSSLSGSNRNTDLSTWVKCLNNISKTMEVILLRDSCNADIPLKELNDCIHTPSRPITSVPYRLALYEAADLSISHEGGYRILMQLSQKVKYHQYYIVDNDNEARDHHTKYSMRIKGGLNPGKDIVFARKNQHIYWGNGQPADVERFLMESTQNYT